MPIRRSGIQQLSCHAQRQSVPIPAGSKVIENFSFCVFLAEILENPHDRITAQTAEAADADRNSAGSQTAGQNVALRCDSLLTVQARGRTVQQQIHRKVGIVFLLAAEKYLSVLQYRKPPDALTIDMSLSGGNGIRLLLHLHAVADVLGQSQNGALIQVIVFEEICAVPFGLSVAEKYGIKGFENPIDMINDSEIDAVMCTTADPYHEEYVLASIAAGKYVFCEKPLAPKADACKRIVEAEMKAGKKLVQVGFMRRYDEGYKQLKAAVDSGKYGEALLLHCAHRNPSVPDDWDNSMAVENSMVHEIDVLRWLLGEDYATAEVRYGKSTNNGPKDLHDPQIMILTTKSGVRIDVESFVNNKNDYDIKCEIVCDGAVLNMPKPNYISVNANATTGQAMYTDCFQRFADAYNAEIQTWINASKAGYVDGPTAWDGYCCQVAAAAASKARETQTIQPVVYDEMPDFYKK